MGFQKGKEWKGNRSGRPKGASNRSSEMQKVNIQRLINEGLDFMKEDYHKIREEDPAKALNLLIKLLEFSVPRLKAVDMTIDADVKQTIEQIKVEVIQKEKNGTTN